MKIAGSPVEARTFELLKIVADQAKAQEGSTQSGIDLATFKWAVELADNLARMTDHEKGVAIIDLIGILEVNKIELSGES